MVQGIICAFYGYFTSVARAAMRSEAPAGGDSFLRFKYAVRSRSVESSSMRDRLEVFGAGVCDADEVAARGSVTILCVHYGRKGTGQ